MPTLIDNFNKLFPAMHAQQVAGVCSIDEQEAADDGNAFRKLEVKLGTAWLFPHELPKKASSIFVITQQGETCEKPCHKVLTKDCDGIFCVEENGVYTFYICELKSGYSTENIVKAKDQIVGSLLKLQGMLRMLQGYDPEKTRFVGLLAAYRPNTERLSAIKNITDQGARFCIKLHDDGKYLMPQSRCEAFYHPLACPDISIVYVSVPERHQHYAVDLGKLKGI